MQSEEDIKRKLSEMFQNYEAEPKDESWEKIRASTQLPNMFQAYEAEPQDKSWEKIRASLDLTQKFQDYEAEPQDDTLDKIMAGVELSQKFQDYEAEPKDDTLSKIMAGVELSQKFQHYEVEPQAESWEKIREAIQPKKRRRGIFIPLFYRVGIAASIALILGGFWWILTNNTKDNDAILSVKSTPKQSKSDILDKSKTIEESQKEDVASTTPKDKVNQTIAATKPVTPKNTQEINSSNQASTHNKTDLLAQGNKSTNNINSVPNKLGDSQKSTQPVKTIDANQLAQGNKNTNKENITPDKTVVNQELTELATTNELTNAIEFKELTTKPFHEKAIRKPFGAIAYNAEKPYQERVNEEKVFRKLILTTSLMPLQTYQAFTILPQTNTYIQQVGRLDAIDNQRLGIQLRAGAMKPLSNRFSTGLSLAYTGVQQWANYELNSGEYEVQTADNGSYTLVGIGEQVAQKQFLQTIGVKLDNAYLVAQKKSKVYVLGGAEAVHVLNNKDYGYYVNASVAVSYPIKGGKSLWIEPTFRYSLSQSFDANNYLKIRPYNIGLNVRVNFI